jgi:hypothetical protein
MLYHAEQHRVMDRWDSPRMKALNKIEQTAPGQRPGHRRVGVRVATLANDGVRAPAD